MLHCARNVCGYPSVYISVATRFPCSVLRAVGNENRGCGGRKATAVCPRKKSMDTHYVELAYASLSPLSIVLRQRLPPPVLLLPLLLLVLVRTARVVSLAAHPGTYRRDTLNHTRKHQPSLTLTLNSSCDPRSLKSNQVPPARQATRRSSDDLSSKILQAATPAHSLLPCAIGERARRRRLPHRAPFE